MGNITHKIRRLKDGQEVIHAGPGMASLWVRGHGETSKLLLNVDGHVREIATDDPDVGGDFMTGPASATDNAIVRFDGATGDLAQNSTPTVEDDGQIGNVTDPTSLQDVATKNYVDNLVATVNVGGAAQNSFLVSGGQVVWQSNYTFTVSSAIYYINGVLYTSPQTDITLTAAHATLDRIDVVAVNDSSAVVVVDGTPSSTPSEPTIDPGTQLKLTIITVGANTTQPADVTQVVVYTNNVGSPTEWNWSTSGSGFNVNSTNNPRSATKDIEGTTVTAGSYAQGQIGTGSLDPNLYTFLVMYIRSKATWQNKRGLQVTLRSNGVQRGSTITINQNAFGFASNQTSSYQQVAIPITQFAVTEGLTIDQVRIADFGGSIGFYLDDISFQGGVTNSGTPGITQEQADARYRLLSVPLVLSSAADVSGDLPLANLVQGTALSVLGVAGNVTADHADIVAVSDFQVLRRSGTSVGFGPINLASSQAVTGDLPFANLTQLAGLSVAGVAGSSTADIAAITAGSDAQVLRRSGSSVGFGAIDLASSAAVTGLLATANLTTPIKTRALVFNIDGGGSAITTGEKLDLYVPFDCTIVEATVLADQSGSIVLDVWKDTYANYPPSVADTITASAKPTLSSATKSTDSTLTGWTTSISAGDSLRVKVDSVSTVTRVLLTLKVTM
jgi:hypothetical protein